MPTKSRWGKIWFKPCLDQVNGNGRARGGGVGGACVGEVGKCGTPSIRTNSEELIDKLLQFVGSPHVKWCMLQCYWLHFGWVSAIKYLPFINFCVSTVLVYVVLCGGSVRGAGWWHGCRVRVSFWGKGRWPSWTGLIGSTVAPAWPALLPFDNTPWGWGFTCPSHHCPTPHSACNN